MSKRDNKFYNEDEQMNWLGTEWMKLFNEEQLPSKQQIKNGILREAEKQMKFAMSNVEDQIAINSAVETNKETWNSLFNISKD